MATPETQAPPNALVLSGQRSYWSGVEQAGLVGQHDGLGAVADLEFLQEPGDMGFDGGVADEQLPSDLGVREAGGDEAEDVHFAGGQSVKGRRWPLWLAP